MRIYVQVKAAGKRRPVLDRVPYEIPEGIRTLRDFLREIVHMEVERYNMKAERCDMEAGRYNAGEERYDTEAGRYNAGKERCDMEAGRYNVGAEQCEQKGTDVQVLPFLTKEEVEERAETGKVAFGRIYSEKKADPVKAVENALQCFEDGLVRVFQNEEELEQLDAAMQIREGDLFTFIRLTFLARRLW